MSDIRVDSGIVERIDPVISTRQSNRHRAEMNRAIIDHRGTVMQFLGDGVKMIFGLQVWWTA